MPTVARETSSPARCIAHCDADRFFFAVEAIERPELTAVARPVIIGRDPREAPRAIVTTANDAARALGISSGMSGARALRLAPQALFVQPRHDLYRAYSARLLAALREASPLVQPLSIDEAWLAWDHRGWDPATASLLREDVLAGTGLSISIGVASSKLVAKMATEVAKPGGVRVVPPGEERAFLAPQPVRALPGVGPRTAERLAEAGLVSIGDLARRGREELIRLLGRAHGTAVWEHAQAIDRSELRAEREPKSYSAEHTFQQDTRDRALLWRELRAQADEVAERLRADGLHAGEVAIKLRYANFQTVTRQCRLWTPTDASETFAASAAALMRQHWDPARAVRLIGLRAARFSPSGLPVQLPLP